MADIREVARKAGVSISTVSYAMNDSPKVNAGTRKKILSIAKMLNYNPSGMAKNLKRKKTNMIGIFLDSVVGQYFEDFLIGAQEASRNRDYGLIVTTIEKERMDLGYRLLLERWVDAGIILYSAETPDDLLLKIAQNIPLVLLDKRLESDFAQKSSKIAGFRLDNRGGMDQLMVHLLKLGYRKFGYLNGVDTSYDNLERFETFRELLKEHSLPFQRKWVIPGEFSEQKAYEETKKFLDRKVLPEAIVSASDEMSQGALRAFDELKVKVPQDIALASFDDIRIAEHLKPPLTTVSYDRFEMGKLAVDMIFDMFEGKLIEKPVLIDTKLIVRESCGANFKRGVLI
jgi:LacI family transcriptional regulator